MRRTSVALASGLLLVASLGATPARATGPGAVSVFATGLNAPRGLAFGPDGDLYVAEGGLGGSATTSPADCAQVPSPIGPYSGGMTARISRISPTGVVSTVIDGLPSSQTQPMPVPLVSGVADVAFVGSTLYALEAAAGCSHGLAGTANGIYRIANGSATRVADLGAFQRAHPVAHPEPEDFEPDGTWYDMTVVRGDLYAVEPNHGELDRITTTGRVSRIVDISRSQGHIVPTALAWNGNFFVGNLSTFPLEPGAARILKITPSGEVDRWATGFTSVLGAAFDRQARIYVLENTTCADPSPCFPTPFAGRVVRLNHDGSRTTIVSGLMLPTGMTFGPDGDLYVSTFGFGAPAGAGTIVRITLH